MFRNQRILVTGGTGSLGQRLVERLLSEEPASVTVFSRDEAKQHQMRLKFNDVSVATDEIIYRNSKLLKFYIGDVRDYNSIADAMHHSDIVIHAAALKQVPTCEYFPWEAVQTNVLGAQNITRAAHNSDAEIVVGISTDKACKPVNVMGMTKALAERIFIEANRHSDYARFVCVRYGNVIGSRGSVIPLFIEQIAHGGPVTVTTCNMTRFLLTLDQAVDTVFAALDGGRPGEIYVPIVPSARIWDVAFALIDDLNIQVKRIGIRPGEKTHEILVSVEETPRTSKRGNYYVIHPLLPELNPECWERALDTEYSSSKKTLNMGALKELLA